jgi:hypothetical protein
VAEGARTLINDRLTLLGALAGGLAGYFLFFWLADRGYFGLAIPGGFLGIGAGVFRSSSRLTPLTCALLALALGVFTEWRYAPFVVDGSFGYFLRHFGNLQPASVIMIAIGVFAGFWVPFRRRKT